MYVRFIIVYYVLVYHIQSYYKMYFNVNKLMKGTKKADEHDSLYIYHKGLVKELMTTRNLRGNRACCNTNGGSLLLFYYPI